VKDAAKRSICLKRNPLHSILSMAWQTWHWFVHILPLNLYQLKHHKNSDSITSQVRLMLFGNKVLNFAWRLKILETAIHYFIT
jgi:hypothetical protein